MQRGLVHAAAWTLATGAAVTLSWWGVHTVLAGTAYDRPRALPIRADAVEPQSSSTQRPKPPSSSSPPPSPSHSPSKTREPSDGPGGKEPSKGGRTSGPAPKPPASEPGDGPETGTGTVKSYTVTGGRAVFDLGETSASLVSATPESGWRMQVWKQSEWIRVDFSQEARTTSVFCTWNGHPPTVQTVNG